MTDNQIENIFTYHAPHGDQSMRYETIRGGCKGLALAINQLTPESREKSFALRALQQVMMWANAAIAINEPPR